MDAEIVDEPTAEDPDPNIATPKQIGKARALLREWGIVSKTDSINLAEMVINRQVQSLSTMTRKEISRFIDHLNQNHPDGPRQ